MSVSIVILAVNEEGNMDECLASCRWSDDVHVIDSGSTDRTADIARARGAHVHVHPFESFGRQRNWALDKVPTKYDWIFHLDADERFTPELAAALTRLVATAPVDAGFYVPEKLMFMGRWLKRAGSYPKYQMRFFHRARMRFRDHGHGQRELTRGGIGMLDEPYLHFALSKGIDDWLVKHNRYSTLEAAQISATSGERWTLIQLLSRNPVDRRRAWKRASRHVPFRPFARWFFVLFIAGGIIEGDAGRTYARLLALYEEMIALKLKLLRKGSA